MDAFMLGLQVLDTALTVGTSVVDGLDSAVQLAEDGGATCEVCRCEWA